MARRPGKIATGLTRKQVSRAKREATIQRWTLIGAGIIIAIVIGVLVFAFVNEQILIPNRVIATVNEDKITISQFQDHVEFELYYQLGGQPLSMYGIDGETFSKIILDGMVDDLLISQKATENEIAVSDADIEEQVQLRFGYDAGAPEPIPTATAMEIKESPTVTPTYVYTLTPRPTITLEPGTTPSATPTSTATPTGKETPTPTSSPQPTMTPITEQAFNDNFSQFVEQASQITSISTERIKVLVYEQSKNNLLRDKLIETLGIKVDDTKIMIHAAHILVATEEEAKNIVKRISDGESFETMAAELSTDASNAYKGGDLGWFGPNQMDPAFEEAAKTVPIGQVSEPVQTQYGWHLIKVYARTNVAMTHQEQESQRQEKFGEMLDQWREEGNVVIESFWVDYLPPQLQSTPTPMPSLVP